MDAGTAGDAANKAVAQQLLAPSEWAQMTGPLIMVIQSIVLGEEDCKAGTTPCTLPTAAA